MFVHCKETTGSSSCYCVKGIGCRSWASPTTESMKWTVVCSSGLRYTWCMVFIKSSLEFLWWWCLLTLRNLYLRAPMCPFIIWDILWSTGAILAGCFDYHLTLKLVGAQHVQNDNESNILWPMYWPIETLIKIIMFLNKCGNILATLVAVTCGNILATGSHVHFQTWPLFSSINK